MLGKLNFGLILISMFCITTMFTVCDPSIYDYIGDDYSTGLELRDFLDAKVCYNNLLNDLEFMKSNCYNDEKLASAQALTILLSYGLADMSKQASDLTEEQLRIKVNLYSAIRLIFIYANSNINDEMNYYDAEKILLNTMDAILYCHEMLYYL